MRDWRALYRKPSPPPWSPLETCLLVRADTAEDARHLAADAFEQAYHTTPAADGFELVSVEASQ